MKWKPPPLIKIYEALGAVADQRVHIEGDTAKISSSTGNKTYEVRYDPATRAIMTNDNGSYWKGYLGYPAIAFLLASGVLAYRSDQASLLMGIAWKDINQKFKNDFDKTIIYIFSRLSAGEKEDLEGYGSELAAQIETLDLSLLGKKMLPPEGY